MIPGGVIGHPVENQVHAQAVGRPEPGTRKSVQGAKVRIDSFVVTDCIITAQRPFAFHDADGVDRHQPKNIDPHFLEAAQLGQGRSQRPLWGKLAHVQFINDSIAGPIPGA